MFYACPDTDEQSEVFCATLSEVAENAMTGEHGYELGCRASRSVSEARQPTGHPAPTASMPTKSAALASI
jgi:hypothetical protein